MKEEITLKLDSHYNVAAGANWAKDVLKKFWNRGENYTVRIIIEDE